MYLYTNKTVLQSILESTFSVQIFCLSCLRVQLPVLGTDSGDSHLLTVTSPRHPGCLLCSSHFPFFLVAKAPPEKTNSRRWALTLPCPVVISLRACPEEDFLFCTEFLGISTSCKVLSSSPTGCHHLCHGFLIHSWLAFSLIVVYFILL